MTVYKMGFFSSLEQYLMSEFLKYIFPSKKPWNFKGAKETK